MFAATIEVVETLLHATPTCAATRRTSAPAPATPIAEATAIIFAYVTVGHLRAEGRALFSVIYVVPPLQNRLGAAQATWSAAADTF